MCGNGLSFRGIRGRSFPLTTDRRRRPSLGRNDPPAAEVVHPELPASTAQTVSPNDYMETSQWKPQSIKRNRLQNSLLCRVWRGRRVTTGYEIQTLNYRPGSTNPMLSTLIYGRWATNLEPGTRSHESWATNPELPNLCYRGVTRDPEQMYIVNGGFHVILTIIPA